MAVTGTVELAAPLGTNMFLEFVTPLSFSFNDGINTLSDINASSPHTFFSFSTDTSGVITDWEIRIEQGYTFPTNIGDTNFRIQTNGPNNQLVIDTGITFTCTLINPLGGCDSSAQDWGVAFNTPGSWSVVPVPAAVWLFGSGLLGLVGVARRKKHIQ
jgi:hypothetical protein